MNQLSGSKSGHMTDHLQKVIFGPHFSPAALKSLGVACGKISRLRLYFRSLGRFLNASLNCHKTVSFNFQPLVLVQLSEICPGSLLFSQLSVSTLSTVQHVT